MLRSLNNISNEALLSSIKGLRKEENKAQADIVLHLYEIDSRGLYREIGYSSLFSYCTEGLGYSEGAAYRRIQAARALKENPEIYELLASGKLSLCAVSEIARVIKPENKLEVLQASIGKAKAEVQKITAKYLEATPALKREKITVKKVIVPEASLPLLDKSSQMPQAQEETRFTFTLEVDQEFMDLLTEVKDITGSMPAAEIFKRTLKEFVSKRKKQPRETIVSKELESAHKPRPLNPDKKPARYVPKAIRYKVRNRDQQQCSFKSPDGHRCTETRALQIDHILPFALGGTNKLSNLRLLCPTHNRLCAEKVFGKEKIHSYFSRGGD